MEWGIDGDVSTRGPPSARHRKPLHRNGLGLDIEPARCGMSHFETGGVAPMGFRGKVSPTLRPHHHFTFRNPSGGCCHPLLVSSCAVIEACLGARLEAFLGARLEACLG